MNPVSLTLRIIAFTLLATLGACATNNAMPVATPDVQDNQAVVELNGNKGLVSYGKLANVTAVVMESNVAKNDLLEVELVFTSNADQTLDIDASNFTAVDNKRAAYQVLSRSDYEYVLNQISINQLKDSTGNQNGGSFVDSSAYTGSSNISSSGDSAYVGNRARQASANETRINQQLDGYLRPTVLLAGQKVSGKICLVFPPGKTKFTGLTLAIPLGNEIHNLTFGTGTP